MGTRRALTIVEWLASAALLLAVLAPAAAADIVTDPAPVIEVCAVTGDGVEPERFFDVVVVDLPSKTTSARLSISSMACGRAAVRPRSVVSSPRRYRQGSWSPTSP